MFRRLSEPLPLSEASLLLLRPALNAPVLNVGYLPIGPARAAVVAFAEEYGGIGIALGVRSSESGQLAVVRNQESIDFDVPLADALEPLLAEAERMGFLFDEDVLQSSAGPQGRSRAMALWADLMGGMERLLPPISARGDDRRRDDVAAAGPLSPSLAVGETQYPELMLDDVAPLVLEGDEPSFDPVLDETLEADPDDELEDTLEDVLDETLDDGEADWELEASELDETDWSEPTPPIRSVPENAAAGRGRALPAPAPGPGLAARVEVPARDRLPPPAPVEPPSPAALAAAGKPVAAPMSGGLEAPRTPVPPSSPVLPRVLLSKFRHVEAPAGAAHAKTGKSEVGADRSSELARIPIVRVRREREPAKRVPFLARLLSSF